MEGGLWLWGGEHHCSVWNRSEERGVQGQRAGAGGAEACLKAGVGGVGGVYEA